MFYFSTHSKLVGTADASFLKTFMATSVNLSMFESVLKWTSSSSSPFVRCSVLALVTDFVCFSPFLSRLFPLCPFLGHLFISNKIYIYKKISQPGASVHWAVFNALSRALLDVCVWVSSQHNQKWTKEGLLQCVVPKKTDKRFICACILAMYSSHGNLLLNHCRV